MNQQDNEFLREMWKKAEEKETCLRLAKELEQMPEPGQMDSFLWNIFKGMGIRQLYAGMMDIMIVAFVVSILFLYFGFQFVSYGSATIYTAAFATAPVIYAASFYLSLLKEKQNQTYEQQMSYKYTFLHLLAARMFTTSIGGLLFNLGYTLILIIRFSGEPLRLLALSFTSLMLFSLLLSAGIKRGKRLGWGVGLSSAWILINLLASRTVNLLYQHLLEQIPVLVLILVGAVAAGIYMRQLLAITGASFRRAYGNAN